MLEPTSEFHEDEDEDALRVESFLNVSEEFTNVNGTINLAEEWYALMEVNDTIIPSNKLNGEQNVVAQGKHKVTDQQLNVSNTQHPSQGFIIGSRNK